MKIKKQINISLPLLDIIIYIILLIVVVSFSSHILTRAYWQNEFTHEFTIKVQPVGTAHFPYPPYHHYNTTLSKELHEVIIKNGNVVRVERIGYAYKE